MDISAYSGELDLISSFNVVTSARELLYSKSRMTKQERLKNKVTPYGAKKRPYFRIKWVGKHCNPLVNVAAIRARGFRSA